MGRRRLSGSLVVGVALLSLGIARSVSAEPVGTQEQLTTFSPSSSSTYCGGPSLAYNSSSSKTLITYIENVSAGAGAPRGGVVRAAFMNSSAGLASAPVDVSTSLFPEGFVFCQPPSVAAGPSGTWLIVWPSIDDDQIYGQLLDSAGQLSGSNFVLSSNTNYTDIETVSAAWSPAASRYLVAWKAQVATPFPASANGQQVAGRFLDANGTGIGGDFLVTDTADGMNNSVHLAYGNSRWVVVGGTNSSQRVIGQVVDSSGPVGSVFDVVSGSLAGGSVGPSIAYNASTNQFMVVFRERSTPYRRFGRLLDGTGAPVGSDIALGTVTGNRPRIASAGSSGYLVTWHGPGISSIGQIYALEVGADGSVIGTEEEVSPDSPFEAWRPDVAYDASLDSFFVAYLGNPDTPDESNYYARMWNESLSGTPGVVTPIAVNFDSQGGSAIAKGTTVNGGNILDPGSPTRAGYTFTGWNTVANGTGATITFPYQHNNSSDFTLYAQWRVNSSTGASPVTVVAPANPAELPSTGGGVDVWSLLLIAAGVALITLRRFSYMR